MAARKPARKLSGGSHERRQAFPEGDGQHDAGSATGGERQRPLARVPAIGRQVGPGPGQLVPRVRRAAALGPVVDVGCEQRPGLFGEVVDACGEPGPEGDLRLARPRAVGQPGDADRAAGLPERKQVLPQPQPAFRPVDRADRSEHQVINRGHRRRLARQVGKQQPHPTHRIPPSAGARQVSHRRRWSEIRGATCTCLRGG